MKKICLYLKKKRYIHGDIKLENFLYKDGLLRLTDLNNMKKTPNINRCVDKIRMPVFYDNLYKKCGDGFYLDYLAINFCMYILLNFTSLDVGEIFKSISYGFSYNCNKILNSENKVFDSEVHKRMIDSFEHIENRSLTKEFLVDCMN